MTVTLAQILPFLLTAVLLTATPGPDNLMVLGVGASKGRRLGMAFGLGCATGCLSHTVLAALGVSAVLAASPVAFTALRVLGGGYLVWLGIGALRSRGGAGVAAAPEGSTGETSLSRQFLKGMLANAINPKVVLFFLSFLPQFVVPAQGHVPLQMAVLGLVFTLQAAVLFGALGWFAGGIGQWLQRRPRAGLWLDRVSGVVFVGLGVRMALSR
ncbi:LysE family translocator [Hydrogenophaga sp. MI9]|uniref:LysE family translocator n=1 Tax=Hydrogenophaga sp. MI9 TaxID=3453719 RepID=UPI003EEA1834